MTNGALSPQKTTAKFYRHIFMFSRIDNKPFGTWKAKHIGFVVFQTKRALQRVDLFIIINFSMLGQMGCLENFSEHVNMFLQGNAKMGTLRDFSAVTVDV